MAAPAPAADEYTVQPCPIGGWGGGSDDEYGGLPLVPELPPPAAAARDAAARQAAGAPPADALRLHVEDVAFQVGNAAHEVRNALRFWSNILEGDGAPAAAVQTRFKQADAKSGTLEGIMRTLVGRVRNVPNHGRPMSILLPKARALWEDIKRDLAALSGEAAVHGSEPSRATLNDLVMRQHAYLTALESVRRVGVHAPDGKPPPLPPPGKRVDFGNWTPDMERLPRAMKGLIQQQAPLPVAELLGITRLACNTAHELQNLAVAPRGGAGTEAHTQLRELDNLAGKCENAARAIMVCVHAWRGGRNVGILRKLNVRAEFLHAASGKGEEILAAAEKSVGGNTVPAGAIALALNRLGDLAMVIMTGKVEGAPHKDKGAVGGTYPTAGAAARGPAIAAPPGQQQKCLSPNCAFAVTGITPQHCCARCGKQAGAHGPRCQRVVMPAQVAPVAPATGAPPPTNPSALHQRPGGYAEPPPSAPPIPHAAAPPPQPQPRAQQCQSPACTFAVTGVARGYCCNMCQKRAGKHGPRCQQRLVAP